MTTVRSTPEEQAAHQAVARAWRLEAGKITAVVARMTRDVGVAEELAQDALVAALEHWPREGIPDNPAAWLTATAKRRALDHLRHQSMAQVKHTELGLDLEAAQAHVVPDIVQALMQAEDDPIGDDLLRLVFSACHPVLPRDAQLALTLKLLGGLSTADIARAFLVPEATIAQRIVRAKRLLASAGVRFDLPPAAELGQRLAAVLEVVYLIFNEGYAATAGDDWLRPALCGEALRLSRMLALLAPAHSEVHGLAALLEIQASRAAARTDAQGQPVLLLQQDRSLWDPVLIEHGLASLARAERLAGDTGLQPYGLQAAIAACHARAAQAGDTDWAQICRLYDRLALAQPSPVVQLNRAVAVGMAQGAAAALPLVQALQSHPQMARYHLLPSVHADLLARLGRFAEARVQCLRAAELALNEREKALLLQRAQSWADAAER
jgi:RNA polymerase sigma factor (sigma-70 family)